MPELEIKLTRIKELMEKQKLGGLLLCKVSSFAWATCGGASYVNTADANGAASILITPKSRFVLTNNIEAGRISKEEMLGDQGWQIVASPWYGEPIHPSHLIGDTPVGADSPIPGCLDLSSEMSRLRANLTPEEDERFQILSKECAEVMKAAVDAVKPGMTEFQIASLLSQAAQEKGIQAIVNLIATDERIFSFRHPLPTGKKLERYAMLVFCGRRQGLVCSITRLVHFGKLPAELLRKSQALAFIDAMVIEETRPGTSLGDIFEKLKGAYQEVGFGDEWMLHHQGGPAGYEPREYIATPESSDLVRTGQVFAWNPSITGTKSEDTILIGETHNTVMTQIDGWPVIQIEYGDRAIARPAILEIP